MRFNGKPLFLPYYLPSLLAWIAASSVGPVLPLYAQSLGAGIAGAGTVIGMVGLGSLVGNIPAGIIIPRFGPRRVLIAAYLTEAIAFALILLFSTVLPLMVLMFITGIAHAMARITQLYIFRGTIPKEQRGRALALLAGNMRIGSFIGPAAGGFIVLYFGYSTYFVFSAAIAAVAGGISFITVPRSVYRETPAVRDGAPSVFAVIRENHRVFLTAGFAIVMLQMMRFARQAILPLWGVHIGIDIAAIGTLFSIMTGVEMLLFYPAGYIMDRFGRRATGLPAMVVLAIALALTPLVASYSVFILVVILSGIGNGLGSGINMTLSTDYAPDAAAGRFLGIWRTIGDAGTTIGPILIGALGAAVSLALAPLIVAGLGLVGALALLKAPPPPLSPPPQSRN